MELKVVHYVSDEDLKIVASRHFIDNEEVSPEDFTELLVGCIEAGEDDEFEDFEEGEDCNECELCEDEIEEDDDDDAEFNMICAWADAINDNDLCPSCVYQVVQDVYYTGKTIGARDLKLKIIGDLSEDIED